MHNFKRLLLGALIFLLVLVVLAFVLENQQSVSLLFFGWSGPQLPISVMLILALLVGMVIGPALGWLLGRSTRAARKHRV